MFKFLLRIIFIIFFTFFVSIFFLLLRDNNKPKFINNHPTEILKPKKQSSATKKVVKSQKSNDLKLSVRQNKIYKIILKNKSIDMKILLKNIPNINERTIRRDLQKLITLGLIVKKGTTKSTFYNLV